ncbi:hypothetical protein LOZ66_003349 [Ophidiomyces ophidiicola]|nr:hypothetical protein LOZ66_003349 [Ophidiomyces ophidiicola]
MNSFLFPGRFDSMDPNRMFFVDKAKAALGPVYHIFDTDKTTRLYSIETSQKSKPHITVTRHLHTYQQPCQQHPQDVVVGSATFHSLSSKIDVSLKAEPRPVDITMKRSDPLACGRKFESPLGKLQWKEDGCMLTSNIKLVDQHKRVIARFEKQSSFLSRRKDKFILLVQEPCALANFDMIVVTGFASIEYARRSDKEWDKAGEELLKAAGEAAGV